jgi:hypothetical protein
MGWDAQNVIALKRSPAIRPGFVLLVACSALARRVRNRIGATDAVHLDLVRVSGCGEQFRRPLGIPAVAPTVSWGLAVEHRRDRRQCRGDQTEFGEGWL